MSVSSVTATPLPDVAPCPHMLVQVGGIVGQTVTLWRSWEGKSARVRGAYNAPVLGGTMDFWDWEAPFGVEVTYRAEVVQGGVLAMAQSMPKVLAVEEVWVSDPLSPRVSMVVDLSSSSMQKIDYGRDGAVLPVAGSSTPIAVVGVRQDPTTGLAIWAHTAGQRLAALTVLQAADPVLFRLPASMDLLPRLAYITAGSVSVEDIDHHVGGEQCRIVLDATLVRPPAASIVVPVRTYQNDLDEDPTYANSRTSKPTYAIRRRGV